MPAWTKQALRAYAEESPADGWSIEASLKFRRDVLAEFNRLVRDSYDKIDAVPPLSLPPFTTPLDLPHLGQERSP